MRHARWASAKSVRRRWPRRRSAAERTANGPTRLGRRLLPLLLPAVFLGGAALPMNAAAQGPSTLPAGIYLTTPDTGVTSAPGKTITFPVDVMNTTDSTALVQLQVLSAPKIWNPAFQDRGYDVSAIQVLPGKDDTLTFQVSPPSTAPVGTSNITLEGVTPGGLTSKLELSIQITGSSATSRDVKLTMDYPVLKGASGAKFEFKATIANNTGKDATFTMTASGPTGWQISFQPTFDSSKQISSIAVKSAQTQDVNVEVQSANDAKPGDYPINMKVVDGSGDQATSQMKVTLAGTYKLDLSTPTQRLDTHATAGQTKTLSIVVANTGTAPVQNISLTSTSMPSGWTMDFKPDKIDSLGAGQMSQVQASLTPSAKALAGDYSITLSATSSAASVNKDFRVTVETPTIWGWVGIAIVVAVLGGLFWLFQSYSRR